MIRSDLKGAEMTELRERARQILRDHSFEATIDAVESGRIELERLLEELHVYHAELYLQQQALLESRETLERALTRFSRLYDELPFPAILVSWQGFVKEANAAAHQALALDRRLFAQLAGEGHTSALEQAFVAARNSGVADCKEIRLRGSSGRALIADVRLIRLPGAERDPGEILCNLVDLTEQVERRDELVAANRRLRIQEERYHVVADFAPDWAYWMTEDGRFRYVSPACAPITGHTAEDFIADAGLLERIIHPEDLDGYRAHRHGAGDTSDHGPLRFRILTRTGEVRWIEHHCRAITGAGGRVLGHRGCNLDVTNQVRLESDLAMALEVIDASSLVAFHWRPVAGWPIAYASRNVESWGYRVDDLLRGDKTYLDLVHPEDREQVAGSLDRFVAGRETVFTQSYRVVWADGSEHWVDAEIRCISDRSGALAYFHGIVSDVTDRVRAEQALKRQLDLQALLAAISSRLVDAGAAPNDSSIDEVLERIGGFFEADRCALIRFRGHDGAVELTHHRGFDGIDPCNGGAPDVALGVSPWWSEPLRGGATVQASETDSPPEGTGMPGIGSAYPATRALIRVPLAHHGRVIGTLGLDRVRESTTWTQEEVRILEVAGQVIAGTLARLESERELVASEGRYREVTAIITDVAYSCLNLSERGYRIDWITDSIRHLVGYTSDELRAMGCWGHLVIPEDQDCFETHVVGLTPDAQSSCELRLRHRDGSIRWIAATTECRSAGDRGGSRRLFGGLVDVTERKAREAEIERLALAVEQSPSIVMVLEPAGTIDYVNARFCEVTGYTPQEVLGRPLDLIAYDGDEAADGLADARASLRDGNPWSGELAGRKKSGEPYWEQARIAPLRDPQGHITHYVKTAEDISARKALTRALNRLSHYDTLTGLPNRVLMRQRIEQALAVVRSGDMRLAVLSIDLDGLRSVNDSLGHDAGDRLLQTVAERWRPLLGEGDILSRFSGDNFLILAKGLRSVEDAARLAQRAQEALSAPIVLGDQEVVVSCSIGIALFPEDSDTAETLIAHADAALHVAKSEGRGLSRFYTAALNQDLQEQFRLEQALHRAIERGELLLHYQSRVEISTGRILGLEALVRWKHPELGMIPPARFIPIAESSGLIRLVGPVVVRLVCEQLAAWRDAGLPDRPVALNLSADELYQEGLAERIRSIADEVGVDHRQLQLEVTESTAMRSIDRAIVALTELNDEGFELAIDDFGTGHASLSYLNRLPVQTLKIDRSFLAETDDGQPQSSQATTIIKAIIALGRSLGLRVIAEGVETARQSDFLAGQGCREAQGFWFGRPLPAEEIEEILRNGITHHPIAPPNHSSLIQRAS